MVDFLNANSAQTPASKSEPNKSQKQHVRVEVEFAEHDYLAFDSDDEMFDCSYAFHGSLDEIRIYVDGNNIEFDVDELLDRSEYSDYESLDLEEEWDNEDIVQFGYDDNEVMAVWNFEVENFDINKLRFYYKCLE